MMHVFPRTFTLPAERGARAAATVIGPLAPATYLRLCREASGQSPQIVAGLLATNADQVADALDLVHALETPGNTARRPETLDALRGVFPFDPDVYRQLATEPADRHPRICRGCGCSEWDARDTMGEGLAWATASACTRCLPDVAPTTDVAADVAIGCFE